MIKTINVTLRDIKKGIKHQSSHCPIARAIKRLTDIRLCVCQEWISFDGIRIPTPQKASDFISNYDLGQPVKPFKFKLDIPQ